MPDKDGLFAEGMSPRATLVANRLAREIRTLSEADLEAMIGVLDRARA